MEVLDRDRSAFPPVIRICFIAIFLIISAGFCYMLSENRRLDNLKSGLEKRATEEQVAVFFIEQRGLDFKLKPCLRAVRAGDGDKHLKALRILFAGPAKGSGFIGIFPEGTGVLGFSLSNGLATVNLNNQATRLNVGSGMEALAVASIVNTLTKFPDVYRVKILVEGKEVESLAGHVDLTGELRYTDNGVDPVPKE